MKNRKLSLHLEDVREVALVANVEQKLIGVVGGHFPDAVRVVVKPDTYTEM
jgi:hypothetical protein